MARTTVSITTNQVLGDAELAALKSAVFDAAAEHISGIELGAEVVAPKLTLRICQDTDAQDPREWCDHVGVMFCKHSQYTLGDKEAENPMVNYGYIDLDGYKLYMDEDIYIETSRPAKAPFVYEDIIELLHEHLDSAESDEDYDRTDSAIAWLNGIVQDIECVERDDIALCLPIYLYDHGGITISHGSFSCQWDSGQVGWHYITESAARENWGKDFTYEQLTACLQAELKEYDHYLYGYVWGFTITNEEGDVVDSCGGYIGDELEDVSFGIRDFASEDEITDAEIEAAWDRRFD